MKADFRVKVWASPGASPRDRAELNNAVMSAVRGSRSYYACDKSGVRATDDGRGEVAIYWSVDTVKPVDSKESETLVIEFSNAQAVFVPNFEKKSSRITREDGVIAAVAWDVDAVTTNVYTVGRNGVTAIRIERG